MIRRHLFLNFLRQAFGIDPVEVELEHKLKVGEMRGRIDALYRHVIVEVKTDFDGERNDAQRELKKYFASRQRPAEYIGIVTDGSRFEAWHLNHNGELVSISEITMRDSDPLAVWRWLDQFLSTGVRRIPTSDELVSRFGIPLTELYGHERFVLHAIVKRQQTIRRLAENGGLHAKATDQFVARGNTPNAGGKKLVKPAPHGQWVAVTHGDFTDGDQFAIVVQMPCLKAASVGDDANVFGRTLARSKILF